MSIIRRFRTSLDVVGYLFSCGFQASKMHSILCVLFDAMSFICIVIAAVSLALIVSSGTGAEIPPVIANIISSENAFTYGVIGMLTALLGSAVSKFFANYVINIALPKIESAFFEEATETLASANITTLSQLDVDVADYLKRDLSINARFAMMVYRRLILTVFALTTLIFLLPFLMIKNLIITVTMSLIFCLMLPIYYRINKRSNQITLDMEWLSKEVSLRRRETAQKILSTEFKAQHADDYIAPSLARNNSSIKDFFHLYGERFTMSEATHLTNACVLFLVIGALSLLAMKNESTNLSSLNPGDFIIILVILRQVHTVVSRGLLVTNTLSRFYTKLLALLTITKDIQQLQQQRKDETTYNPKEKPTSFVFAYEHVTENTLRNFSIEAGNVHLLYDENPPTRLSLLRLKPQGQTEQFVQFLSSSQVVVMERTDTFTTFDEYRSSPKKIESMVNANMDVLMLLFDEADLRLPPKEKLTLTQVMMQTLGPGQSYLTPRVIKVYEIMIDLQKRLEAVPQNIIFLDLRALVRFYGPFAEKSITMMEGLGKTIFITLSKQTYSELQFNPDRPVIVADSRNAIGYIEYSKLSEVIKKSQPKDDHDLDDELTMG